MLFRSNNAISLADGCTDRLLKKDMGAPIHAIRYDLPKKTDDGQFDGVKAWLNATSGAPPPPPHSPPEVVPTATYNQRYTPELNSE